MTRYETLFSLGLLAALWALMPITQMWDWDEPLYARTGIEMWLSGNLLLPRFNDEIFAHKPPLGYWLMGLSAQVFGATEFAARFFSAPLMVAGALLVGRTARAIFDVKTGEAALTVFGTALMTQYLGAAAMMDAPLFAGYALSVWAFVHIVLRGRASFALLALFSAGLLVTLLVKGPVGPALIGGMVLGVQIFLAKGARPSWATFAALFGAGLVALAGFLAWFLPANAASNGALLREGVGIHIIGRALAPMEGHGGQGLLGFLLFLPIYIPVIFLGLLPWSVALPQSISALFRQMGRRERVLLLAWFLPTFLAFSIAATKLPHYIFPALAPLAVLVGYGMNLPDLRTARAARWAALLGYLVLAGAFAFTALRFGGGIGGWKLLAAALIFAAMGALVLRAPLSARAVLPLAIASLVAQNGVYWLGLTEVDRLTKLSREIGQQIAAQVPADAPIIHATYGEPSLIFYASRPIGGALIRVAPEELATEMARHPMGYAVLTDQERALLAQAAPQLALTPLHAARAYNLNQNGVLQTVTLLHWQQSP